LKFQVILNFKNKTENRSGVQFGPSLDYWKGIEMYISIISHSPFGDMKLKLNE
jgi:hypothetical protein